MIKYGDEIDGAIISGTAGNPGFPGVVGKWIAKTEQLFRGKRSPSKLMNYLSFSSFNKR